MMGLLLLSEEGYNVTVSGTPAAIEAIKNFVKNELRLERVIFKDSVSDEHPYGRFKVQIREEIVTIGDPSKVPAQPFANHVSPREFHELLKSNDVVAIDTRNKYELKVGKFKNAVDLEINVFTEFPEKIKSLDLPKNKKVLIYCTGGIRCEKAIIEMKNQGFENVLQLSGGILKYLEEVKEDSQWEGECFVFDRRVALDHDLRPSVRYGLCPHCGEPATLKRECIRCDRTYKSCENCLEIPERHTCSKHCAYLHKTHPGVKGPPQKKVLL
jgi:UPF0176 protein